jgi:hypothetical protein
MQQALRLRAYCPNIYTVRQGVVFNFSQEFLYYVGHRGNNTEFDFRASGAYIFRPQVTFMCRSAELT